MLMVWLTTRDKVSFWVLKVFACNFSLAFPVPSQIATNRTFATLPAYILLIEVRISEGYVKRGKTTRGHG
jgi:hypothetical protein